LLFIIILAFPVLVEGRDRSRLKACVDSCDSALSKGEYAAAMRQADEALEIADDLRDSASTADVLVQRSTIRMMMGDYNNSLTDLQSALSIYDAIGDEHGIATVYTSIGSIHYYDRNYARAQQYYLRSLAIRQRIGDRSELATLYGNIGSVLEEMGRPDSALVYHHRHLAMRLAEGARKWIPICYSNLGVCHDKLGNSDSALHYLQASLAMFSADDRQNHAHAYAMSMLGVARLHAGQTAAAIAICEKGLAMAQELADLPMQEQCYSCLYQAYQELGNAEKALPMYQRYVAVRDSITGEQRAKELIRIEVTYDFERLQLADSLKQVDARRQAEFAYQQRLSRERDQKRLLILSSIGVLLLAGGLWSRLRYMKRSRNLVQSERDRSERLLLNILPKPIAEELKEHGRARAREVEGVSILFTDFNDFTRLSERMGAQELVAEIDACFRAFDAIAAQHGLEKIKTIGDAYMCAGGLPEPRANSARDTVLAALHMQRWLVERSREREAMGLPAFRMRAGVHTGHVVAGIVGDTKFQYDIWGDTVNIAARIESAGAVDEVNISEATFQLLQADPGLTFSARGRVEAKGKGGLEMYFVREALTTVGTPQAVLG
jgi:class 3 adenylate cyclase/Tfp pilus assembly protein PilF